MSKADDECPECDGTGMVCLCCKSALDECSCGPDAEPCYCDKCHGNGTKTDDDDEDAEALAGSSKNEPR